MNKLIFHGRLLAVLIGCILGSGCQNLPATPENKYYRLLALPTTNNPAQAALLQGDLVVHPLHAESLYSERAIVFGDEQQRQLQQYHYQYWLYPPAKMVREHLMEHLRQSGIAPAVWADEREKDAPYAISGRIMRFEKIIGSGKENATAMLELRLIKKSRLLWQQTYTTSEPVADGSMNAFSASMETALNRIYNNFINDLRKLKLD